MRSRGGSRGIARTRQRGPLVHKSFLAGCSETWIWISAFATRGPRTNMLCAVCVRGLNLSGHPQACSSRTCRAHAASAPRTSAPLPCAEGGRARAPVPAAFGCARRPDAPDLTGANARSQGALICAASKTWKSEDAAVEMAVDVRFGGGCPFFGLHFGGGCLYFGGECTFGNIHCQISAVQILWAGTARRREAVCRCTCDYAHADDFRRRHGAMSISAGFCKMACEVAAFLEQFPGAVDVALLNSERWTEDRKVILEALAEGVRMFLRTRRHLPFKNPLDEFKESQPCAVSGALQVFLLYGREHALYLDDNAYLKIDVKDWVFKKAVRGCMFNH